MKVGVLGTGTVGHAIAGRLVELGHEVVMGARSAGNERAVAWAESAGDGAGEGSFADAAGHGEIVVNATAGVASLEALGAVEPRDLPGKVLIDVANPIEPGSGMPPSLAFCNTDSLGERIQRAFPDARVVKTLNTVNADVMVGPGNLPGSHDAMMCGDDPAAKAQVADLLQSFGWPREDILDLGGIEAARGMEMYLALWLRLFGVVGAPRFNVKVVRG